MTKLKIDYQQDEYGPQSRIEIEEMEKIETCTHVQDAVDAVDGKQPPAPVEQPSCDGLGELCVRLALF